MNVCVDGRGGEARVSDIFLPRILIEYKTFFFFVCLLEGVGGGGGGESRVS